MDKNLKKRLEIWTTKGITGRPLITRNAFLNDIRKHTDIIIIFPKERILLTDKDDWKNIIKSTVLLYQNYFRRELMKWNGETPETHVHQVCKLLKHHFLFDEETISDKIVERVVERIMLNN